MKKMHILTIGNSFTDSLADFFPQVVVSTGNELVFDRANFGGCELARHWCYIEAEEREACCRIYQGGRKMREILASKAWDVVTIQQASHDSWRTESFEPYASNIIAYVRKHAPTAEVVIQQTWAYRGDHPQFQHGSDWGIGQQDMHARLTENYINLGIRHQLRIIPTGLAVQLTRENDTVKFKNYPASLINELHWPDLPPQAGDVVGACWWRKDQDSGELKIDRDLIHLNRRGQYMQACLWYAFLFSGKTGDVRFVPDEIGAKDAAFLRETAQQAIDRGLR